VLTSEDRIWFVGNPWPAGHRIAELAWEGWLDPTGEVRFGFFLESVYYLAEDPPGAPDKEPGATFTPSRSVWDNYGECTIRTGSGFVVGTSKQPLDFAALAEREFLVDPLDGLSEPDDEAFTVYLLGHDSIADHRIRFPVRHADFRFGLEWTGRAALTYVGDTEYRYAFRVRAGDVPFRGFAVPRMMDDDAACALLAECVVDASRFTIVAAGRNRFLRPNEG